jgi:type IV secretion system protein TrbL
VLDRLRRDGTLIVIDITIAALFWAWGTDEDVLQRLVKKTLYIGVFAFIIGNFQALATILLESFAGLGLKAAGSAMAIGDFMRPGMIASTGLDAAEPLLDATADLVGPVGLFTNFVQILILLIAWVIVVIAFFILAVQVFVTILEFKLVTLAGFVLLPFAFFGRTAFMAERVLGHIISSGIKLLVLAVITGIGTTLFQRFMDAGLGTEPDIREVMAIALGALTLLGLGIFGPSVANGIVASSAVGRTALGASRASGSASASYARGAAGKSGMRAFGAGLANVARDTARGAGSPLRAAADRLRQSYAAGQAGKSAAGAANAGDGAASPPTWAAAMKRRQAVTSGATIASQTLKAGDSHGAGSAPDINQKD